MSKKYMLKLYNELGSLDLPIQEEWIELINQSFKEGAIYELLLPNKTILINFSLIKTIEIGEKKYLSNN